MGTKGPKLIEARIVQNLQPTIDAVWRLLCEAEATTHFAPSFCTENPQRFQRANFAAKFVQTV
jgi:hypothetical protein